MNAAKIKPSSALAIYLQIAHKLDFRYQWTRKQAKEIVRNVLLENAKGTKK